MEEVSSRVDVWLGSSLGIMKGVSLDPLRCTNHLPGGLSLSHTDKSHEMLCVWRERETLYLGLKRGVVQTFDCLQRRFTMECDVTAGSGTLVGVAKHDRVLITCSDGGSLSFWPPGEEKWEREVGGSVYCMAASGSGDLRLATGGRENPLKLWDSQHSHTPIFTAKNVRPDRLGLRVPVWVKRVAFVPDSDPQPVLVTGTGYGDVRMYDTRAQRRPLFSTKFGDEPITALCVTPDGRGCVVGNSVGEVGRCDLRKGGGLVGQYKGFGGAVTAVDVSGDACSLAACGLDRYLRVYRLERPALLHQVYVKLQCRCLIFGTGSDPPTAGGDEGEGEGEEEESDGEGVWASMETVGDHTRIGGGGKRIAGEGAGPTATSKRSRTAHSLQHTQKPLS